MNSMHFTRKSEVTADSIVCLAKHSDAQTPSKCLWFVRLSVDGGNPVFEQRFGSRFLWLVHPGCAQIIMDHLREHDRVSGAATPDPLYTSLHATMHDFNPRDWEAEGCRLAETIPDYYQRGMAMSVMPSLHECHRRLENKPPQRMPLTRPEFWEGKRLRASRFDVHALGTDVSEHILGILFGDLAASGSNADLRTLVQLRQVSKGFRAASETAAQKLVEGLRGLVKRANEEKSLHAILNARDALLKNEINALDLLWGISITRSGAVRCLCRLRTGHEILSDDEPEDE